MMKGILIYVVAVLLYAGFSHPASGSVTPDRGTVSYMDALEFEETSIGKAGRKVSLSMRIVLDSMKIKPQHTVSLTPVLVSADGAHEYAFGTFVVDGRTRNKVFVRKEALGEDSYPERDSALAVVVRKNGSAQEYSYLSVIPYNVGMLDGSLVMRESVTGCADCGEGESETGLGGPVLPRFVPVWKTSGIEPEPEPVKHREESRIARLQFRWDNYEILGWWKDNAAVLDTVTNSIALVKEKNYIEIEGVYVAGYASPEGSWDYNMKLSYDRATSFARYIAGHNDIDTSLVHVEWGGEDWQGFRSALAASDFRDKDAVLEIIDGYGADRDGCERRIIDLVSRSGYVWLLRNIYPYLRHCTYRVEYSVKGFDLDQARKVIYENPSDLSLSEMYMVAGSYGKDSAEYGYAMRMAAKYYPDAPAVVGDRALAALEAGDPEAAAGLLEALDLSGKPELVNMLGVAYAGCGEYEKAMEAISAAAEAGCLNASHNLNQLAAVIDQL